MLKFTIFLKEKKSALNKFNRINKIKAAKPK